MNKQGKGKTMTLPSCQWEFLDVPSDMTIKVDGSNFSLHKFPLISRSGRMRTAIAEHRESDLMKIELLALPGGADTFELVAKFCYGISFDITPANVAELRCVSDYLEMTEEYSNNNLGSLAEDYLDTVVCKSLTSCVEVLQHCESLIPLADELKVSTKCIEAMASKACAEQMASSFSRLEYSCSGRLQMSKEKKCGMELWIDEITALPMELYERVIVAVRRRGVSPESIGASLMKYAWKKNLIRKWSSWNQPTPLRFEQVTEANSEEKQVVEAIVSLLPTERSAISTTFLFEMLRNAMILNCSSSTELDLERRIGSQLDSATLDDLLIPSISQTRETLFDVDTIHRILIVFSQIDESDEDLDDEFESDSTSPTETALRKVSVLIDSYLAEIAPDANLKLGKFIEIASTLPAHARVVHDGLYRAVDIYLKAHQNLSEPDRKKLSRLINFQKLSQEAASHAAQNERLPLQSIVQVLYHEQIRLRNSFFSSYSDDDPTNPIKINQPWKMDSGFRARSTAASSPGENYATLRRENGDLKLELARMRMRLNDLEKDHVCMHKNMKKSGSRKLIGSFSKKIANVFSHSTSRGSSIDTE